MRSQMLPSVVPSDEEYVRPLVPMQHDKPASHPQKVHISAVGTLGMGITWVTDDWSAPSVAEYRTSPGKYSASEMGYCTTYQYLSNAIHHMMIGPLEPSTTYYYLGAPPPPPTTGSATRYGMAGDELSLRTPPANLPIEFAIINDIGQTKWTASTLSQIGAAGDHNMLLLPSDLSYVDMQQPLWDSWGRLVQPLVSAQPWMVTEGNHVKETLREPPDYATPCRIVAYDARWCMPHRESGSHSNPNLSYSFDATGSGAHIIMLGSDANSGEGSEQREWLRRDHGCTNYAHQGEGEGMRKTMESLLYEACVDVIFASHVHAYERFDLVPVTFWPGINVSISIGPNSYFGHGRLRIVDERRAVWTWHRNDDEHATVSDEV
uniref:Purple acid phosphatase n=1 Tax=Setaria viridis TaxID=4556 RepID=A0A4U6THS4_SETVI|nr:hypothetical protein SEVIR_8G108300v2 [Setaria viridis]